MNSTWLRDVVGRSCPGCLLFSLGLLLCCLWSLSPQASAAANFNYGIMAGEVQSSSILIWGRTGVSQPTVVRYGLAPDALTRTSPMVTPQSTDDYTFQVEISGLLPATTYYYQVVIDPGAVEVLSPIGQFRTAPADDVYAPMRLGFSGDIGQDNDPRFNNLAAQDFDLYLAIGDWPYADAARSLVQYWGIHRNLRDGAEMKGFMRSTAIHAIYDDHEALNDWDGADTASQPARIVDAIAAEHDYFPFRFTGQDDIYRTFKYGAGIEVFILDTRRYRAANADPNDASKTMLGPVQRDWLFDSLLQSTADFKLLVSSVPFDHGTTGNDHWVGFLHERKWIRDFIITNQISGVVILTTDQHWLSVNQYPDGIREYETGPLTAGIRTPPEVPNYVRAQEATPNYGVLEYVPASDTNAATLHFEARHFTDNSLIYEETMNAGRGEVQVNIIGAPMAPWVITGDYYREGSGTTRLPNVAPGDYTITFQDSGTAAAPSPVSFSVQDEIVTTLEATYTTPLISTQPATQFVRPGATATFAVTAAGIGRLRYQWIFEGIEVDAATNSALVITNAQSDDAGLYHVRVTDDTGPLLSDPARLVLLIDPLIVRQPRDQTVVEGATVTMQVGVTNTANLPIGYRWRRNGRTIVPFDEGTATLTLTNVQLDQAGNYTVVVTNLARLGGILSARAVLAVLVDSDGDQMPDDWETDNGLDPEDPADASGDLDGDGLVNLDEYVAGTDPKEASSHLRLDRLSTDEGPATVSFLAVSNRSYTVQFREETSVGRWTWLAAVAAQPSNRVATVIDPYTPTKTRLYRLITPQQAPPSPGPVILGSPKSQEVQSDSEVTLSVIATGREPLTYQWQFNGKPLNGATDPTLVLSKVRTNDIGHYSVTITDTAGSVTSQAAYLSVLIMPVITVQPQSQIVATGENVVFTVTVTGLEPLSYLWFFNDAPLRNARGPELLLENLTAATAGRYAVAVKHETPFGPAGVMSRTATLQVRP